MNLPKNKAVSANFKICLPKLSILSNPIRRMDRKGEIDRHYSL